MTDNKYVRTSVLQYWLDWSGLEDRFSLVMSPVVNKQDYELFYAQLQTIPVLSMTKIKSNRYLILLDAELAKKAAPSEYFIQCAFQDCNDAGYDFYPNHILQLLINCLEDCDTDGANNYTAAHYCVRPNWSKKTQCYGLQISVDWQNNLCLTGVTFSKVSQVDENGQYYYWNADEERMLRCWDLDRDPLYEKHNYYDHRNSIKAIRLDHLRGYENSKVGVANEMLSRLKTVFSECFREREGGGSRYWPRYNSRDLLYYNRGKRDRTRGALWSAIENKTINIYCSSDSERVCELADATYHGLIQNAGVQAHNITIERSSQSRPGLNIQILEYEPENEDDVYEVSHDDTVIFHLTPNGFGDQHGDKSPDWNEEIQQIAAGESKNQDAKTRKISQEIVIRRDIVLGTLTSISDALVEKVQKYTYFLITPASKDDYKVVNVAKMTVDQNRHLMLSRRECNGDEINDDLDEVYQIVYDNARGKKKYWLKDLLLVIKADNSWLVIRDTNQQTMPDIEWIRQELNISNPNMRVDREQFLRILEDQLQNAEGAAKRNRLLQIIAQVEKIPKVLVSKGEVNQSLKEVSINWQGGAMAQINNDLRLNETFEGAFLNGIFKKENEDHIRGYYGIGLLVPKKPNTYNYFSAATENIRKVTARGNHLKKVDLVDIPAAYFEKEIFLDVADMMSVTFVRNNQNTVVPFPAKYLREYLALEDRL